MSEKDKNQKTKIPHDLVYILNVSKEGCLWWKKPIYRTHLRDIIVINENPKSPIFTETLYKGDKERKDGISAYIDNKLEELGIFSKNIISDNYRLNINSKWSNEELDKAIDKFVNKVIKYKS